MLAFSKESRMPSRVTEVRQCSQTQNVYCFSVAFCFLRVSSNYKNNKKGNISTPRQKSSPKLSHASDNNRANYRSNIHAAKYTTMLLNIATPASTNRRSCNMQHATERERVAVVQSSEQWTTHTHTHTVPRPGRQTDRQTNRRTDSSTCMMVQTE